MPWKRKAPTEDERVERNRSNREKYEQGKLAQGLSVAKRGPTKRQPEKKVVDPVTKKPFNLSDPEQRKQYHKQYYKMHSARLREASIARSREKREERKAARELAEGFHAESFQLPSVAGPSDDALAEFITSLDEEEKKAQQRRGARRKRTRAGRRPNVRSRSER